MGQGKDRFDSKLKARTSRYAGALGMRAASLGIGSTIYPLGLKTCHAALACEQRIFPRSKVALFSLQYIVLQPVTLRSVVVPLRFHASLNSHCEGNTIQTLSSIVKEPPLRKCSDYVYVYSGNMRKVGVSLTV